MTGGPSLRVIAAMAVGGVVAAALWIVLNLSLGGMFHPALILLGALPGLAARTVGGRGRPTARAAAAIAVVALLAGKGQAIEMWIQRERASLAPEPKWYDYRAKTAALWIEERGAPLGTPAAKEVVLEFFGNHAPRVLSVPEHEFEMEEIPFIALRELEEFHANPPTLAEWNEMNRPSEERFFDQQVSFWRVWCRSHSPIVLLFLGLGALASYRIARGALHEPPSSEVGARDGVLHD